MRWSSGLVKFYDRPTLLDGLIFPMLIFLVYILIFRNLFIPVCRQPCICWRSWMFYWLRRVKTKSSRIYCRWFSQRWNPTAFKDRCVLLQTNTNYIFDTKMVCTVQCFAVISSVFYLYVRRRTTIDLNTNENVILWQKSEAAKNLKAVRTVPRWRSDRRKCTPVKVEQCGKITY